jgi:phosphoribosyl 1,2-cyclic phosphodiesterase
VRGSIPAPGPETARYGGNTPCVEIRCGSELLVFDLGSGVRALGETYGAPINVHVFVSHYHYDHLQGLPFFTPMFNPGSRVQFFGPARNGRTVKDVIVAQMQQPFFPVTAEMVFRAQVEYRSVSEGDRIQIGDAVVTALEVNHPGGNLAYRVDYQGKSVVYATDTEHGSERDTQLERFAYGADLLIYDSMYSEEEYRGRKGAPKIGWGHSTFENAVRVADNAKVKTLCLFHHDPTRSDAALDKMLREVKKHRKDAIAAREGQTIKV